MKMHHMKRKGFRFSPCVASRVEKRNPFRFNAASKIARRTHANAPPSASFYLRGGGGSGMNCAAATAVCRALPFKVPMPLLNMLCLVSVSIVSNSTAPHKSAAKNTRGWAGAALSIDARCSMDWQPPVHPARQNGQAWRLIKFCGAVAGATPLGVPLTEEKRPLHL